LNFQIVRVVLPCRRLFYEGNLTDHGKVRLRTALMIHLRRCRPSMMGGLFCELIGHKMPDK